MSKAPYLITGEAQIKITAESLGLTFILAESDEANVILDSKRSIEYPVLVYMAPTKKRNKQVAPNAVQRRLSVFCFILYKMPQATLDAKTEDARVYTLQAEYKADQLIKNLNNADITDDDGIESWETNETYAEFDANLHGVTLAFEWPITDLLSCGG